jgi:hypothetical protein
MWNWYEWDSLEFFNTWHEAIKVKLGIPDEQTEAYTSAQEVEGRWIAVVEESEAEGLTSTELRPPKPDAFTLA